MFCRSQTFPIEKKDFVWLFLLKKNNCVKKPEFKIWLQIIQIGNPAIKYQCSGNFLCRLELAAEQLCDPLFLHKG